MAIAPPQDAFVLAGMFMGIVLNILVTILMIAWIVKVFMAVMGMAGGKWNPFSKKGRTGSPEDEAEKKRRKENDEQDEDKKREEWRSAIENPAFLIVQVRNEDDKPVADADVVIFAKGHKGQFKMGPWKSNKDGIWPATGKYLPVPSNTPIVIKVDYWLPKGKKYLTEERSVWKLGLGKQRRFTNDWKSAQSPDRVTLAPGQEYVHDIKLGFRSEYAEGFEPFIHDVKVVPTDPRNPTGPRTIYVEGEVKSTPGR